jgi:hypothetical protein
VIFVTNRFIPSQYSAYTRGPFILVRPENQNDYALIEHERVHVRQWWRMPLIHQILYRFSKSYRLKAEVEAYRRQLEIETQMVDVFAGYLANNYGLGISELEARQLLRG